MMLKRWSGMYQASSKQHVEVSQISLETSTATFKIQEQPDGSLKIKVQEGGSLVIDPVMSNVIVLGTRED